MCLSDIVSAHNRFEYQSALLVKQTETIAMIGI